MVMRDAIKQGNRSSPSSSASAPLVLTNVHQQIARCGWLWLQLEFWEGLLAAQLMFHVLSEYQAFESTPRSEG